MGEPAPADRLAPEFPVAGWERDEFLAVLGRGGMGSVYRARDRRLGRDVALKFIRGGDPRPTMRLLREARALARLEHDNICKIFEVDEIQGKAFIVMQFVDGRPCTRWRPSCRCTTSWGSSATSRWRCTRRTSWGSSTATSSRATSSSSRPLRDATSAEVAEAERLRSAPAERRK